MFEGAKIKRILGKYPSANDKERREHLDKLVQFGEMIVPYVADELRFNRMLFTDAAEIFNKLFNRDNLPAFVKGLGDTKENVRLLYKETIAKRGGAGIASQLVESLADDDNMVRRATSELIIELGDPSISSRVIPYLSHQNREIKKVALDVLCSFKADKATDAILPLLDDGDSWVRRKAVDAICKLENKATVPRLIEAVGAEKDPGTVKVLLGTVGKIGGPEHAMTLLPFLNSHDMTISQLAVEGIINIGDSSIISSLLKYLGDEDVNVRRGAVEILNGLKDPKSAAVLVKALKDGDWWVREIATDALSELGGSKISEMIKGLLHDEDEGVRRSAVEFYCKVKDPQVYEDLIKLLGDEDWWVREKAITALGVIGDKRAIPEISKLLGDREVVWAIPRALQQIGGEEALKPVSVLLSHAQKQVRMEALKVISEIESQNALQFIKEMVRDEDTEIQGEALKILKDRTGRVWLADEVLEELEKTSPSSGPLISRTAHIKPGDLLTEAIMVVDLANSTDTASVYGESLALRLTNTLASIIKPVTQSHRSRFQKSTGDGFLITFNEMDEAVDSALEILEKTLARNRKVEKKERILIRIALSFGETRVDDASDRQGLAVNMAFRVEGVQRGQMIQTPGGVDPDQMPAVNRILLTEAAAQQVKESPSFETQLLGIFELKGFTGLHRVFQLVPTE